MYDRAARVVNIAAGVVGVAVMSFATGFLTSYARSTPDVERAAIIEQIDDHTLEESYSYVAWPSFVAMEDLHGDECDFYDETTEVVPDGCSVILPTPEEDEGDPLTVRFAGEP